MYFEEFEIGQTFEIQPVMIEKHEMLDFAKRYDPLPFHIDEDYAKTTRYKSLIAPGAFSFLVIWSAFTKKNVWGDEIVGGYNTKVEWFAPVYAGDALRANITVSDLMVRNAYNGMVELYLEVFNQNDQLVIKNTTQTVVMREPNHPDGND